ncbi:hypothetical protein E8E14_012193 [Neopestalotiopsis sp. 37M]|nr:hypothetical protein E8E14_012193 [Neopestalotiopsis sp. 37M]
MDRRAMSTVRQFADDQNARGTPDPDDLIIPLAQTIEYRRTEERSGRNTFAGSIDATLSILNNRPEITEEYEDQNEKLVHLVTKLEDAWKKIVKKTQQNEKTTNEEQDKEPQLTKAYFDNIVNDCQKKLQYRDKDKWARTKNWFRKTSGTLNNHNYLFALLPTGDKYTSIITGTFTVLVKAGAAYDDVVDKFEEYLDTTHDKIILMRKHMTEMPLDPFLRVQLIKFTIALFEFLFQVLTWLSSSRERFMSSFSDNLQKTCDRLMAKMRDYGDNVREYCGEAKTQRLGRLIEAGLLGQAQNHYAQRYAQTHAPTHAAQSCTQSDQALLSDASGLSDLNENAEDATDTDLPASPSGWDKSSVLESTAHLAGYSQDELYKRLCTQFKDLSIHVDVYSEIQKWISSTSGQALAIEGPAGAIAPSSNTLCAAYISSRVQQLSLPAVRYFCFHDYERPLNAGEKLRELVYSLIYQVAVALPEQVDSSWHLDVDLGSSRFSCLNDNMDSLDSCIDLLGDLFKIAPPLTFCIIDGLQLLARDSSPDSLEKSLQHLLDTLAPGEVGTDAPTVLKVLFTTDGVCLPLKRLERLGRIRMVESSRGRGTELLRLRESDLPEGMSQ